MVLDQDAFFHQLTLRICSSLDIEVALRHCIDHLKTFIPLVAMNLSLYHKAEETLESIAHVTMAGTYKLPERIQLPPEARTTFEDLKKNRVLICNRPDSDPTLNYVLKTVGQPERSLICMYLELEGEWLGILTASAEGCDRYTEEHGRLISLLHEPFAIAMSNALRYLEILKLKNELADDNEYLQQELRRMAGTDIIGTNSGLKNVMQLIHQVAGTESPVILLGETGVGKEVIANEIHRLSIRSERPLIKVNCGAISETLIDSELFGHEKGAFTGAVHQKRGHFERADRGTIFLDEIGELPAQAQTRLLRVVQHKQIERLGGINTVSVDIRIIAATHQDLERMVAERKFREDLWFRLNVFPIRIPALRERVEDIPALVDYFLAKKSNELMLGYRPKFHPSLIDRFKSYHWPGNVREIENTIEHALILHKGRSRSEPLQEEDFPFLKKPYLGVAADSGNGSISSLDAIVRRHIQAALKVSGGKIHGNGGAAELLGLKPTTLRYRMEKLSIPFKRERLN